MNAHSHPPRWLHSSRQFGSLLLVWIVAAAALFLRAHQLELRPFHSDEAVQAVKTGELYDRGEYRYDPAEFHGPSLYYLTLPILKVSGAHSFADTRDSAFRCLPVLFGTALTLLLLLLRHDLGAVATGTAAIMLAISPAMVFYSRYYIQEIPLVFFAALALGALWRYLDHPQARWSVLLGLALGLMYTTKETSVLFGMAMIIAAGGVMLHRRAGGRQLLGLTPRRFFYHSLLTILVAGVVAGLFYSSFLTNPRGLLDSLLAFRQYVERSDGTGSAAFHQQPWHYYLKMLAFTKDSPGPWWSEALILGLAAIGIVAGIRRKTPSPIRTELAFFLALYSIAITAIFAAIPYKTPWNLLGFLHGLILMAGIGAAAVFHHLRSAGWRVVWMLLLLGGVIQLAGQAWRANHRFCADPRNPYVYAHSVPDVVRLAQRIEQIALLDTTAPAPAVHFITADYWPLPYYLRRLKRVGYWQQIPATPEAPLMVVSSDLTESLQPLLHDRYHTEYYGLRPGVLLVLHVQEELWQRFLEKRVAP